MRKSWALLLLGAVSAVALLGVACPGPQGPTGSAGPTGTQGANGNIGKVPPSSLFRHVVVSGTNGAVFLSADMIEVQTNFLGGFAATAGNGGLADQTWGYVLALSNGTASTGALVSNVTSTPIGYTAARPIGRAYFTTAVGIRPFRQVDRVVTYWPGKGVQLVNVTAPVSSFTSVNASSAVPPGTQHVFVHVQLTVPGPAAGASTGEVDWSLDGGNQVILAQCTGPATGTGNCVNDSAQLLDAAQHFQYKVAGPANTAATVTITGYIDETL